jgi:hypothetical protein
VMEETASRSGNIGSSWRRIEAPARLLHTMCGEAKGCDMVRDSRVVASAMLPLDMANKYEPGASRCFVRSENYTPISVNLKRQLLINTLPWLPPKH